jgi:hypothetical protein
LSKEKNENIKYSPELRLEVPHPGGKEKKITGKTVFLSRLNPRSLKKDTGFYETRRFLRKRSIPKSPGLWAILPPAFPSLAFDSSRTVAVHKAESSQSQLRDSGGFGTKSPAPHFL